MRIQALALVVPLLCLTAMPATAAEVRLEVRLDEAPHEVGQRGEIRVIVDNTDDPLTFQNGGLAISMASSTPGVIEFTHAFVIDPAFFGGAAIRWSGTAVLGLAQDAIEELSALALAGAGGTSIDGFWENNQDGGPGLVWYANIEFRVLGYGSTDISIGPITSRPGHFIVQEGVDVSDRLSFTGTTIDVRLVPEPSSVAILLLPVLVQLVRRSKYSSGGKPRP